MGRRIAFFTDSRGSHEEEWPLVDWLTILCFTTDLDEPNRRQAKLGDTINRAFMGWPLKSQPISSDHSSLGLEIGLVEIRLGLGLAQV